MKIVVPGKDMLMMRQVAADGGGMGELHDTFGKESDDNANEEFGLWHPHPTSLGLHTSFMGIGAQWHACWGCSDIVCRRVGG